MKLVNKQEGFSLVEVLVAGFVITFGLVGMVLMQTYSQQDAFRAHQLSLAGLYAQDMQERLRANVCFLSPEVDDIDDPQEVENFIDDDLDDFLNDMETEWTGVHFIEGRTAWSANLRLGKNKDGDDWNANDVVSNGYWQFELEIQPPQPTRSATVQTLLIDYREGCEE